MLALALLDVCGSIALGIALTGIRAAACKRKKRHSHVVEQQFEYKCKLSRTSDTAGAGEQLDFCL